MTQEDGFIEVKCYLTNQVPIIRWVRPVIIKKVKLLFDVFAIMTVARESGLTFIGLDEMDPEEYMAWMVYGGMKSYASLRNKRLDLSINEVLVMLDGMLNEDRAAILETVKISKEIGQLGEAYQKARDEMANQEGDGESKKAPGQVSGQKN